jgi:hypothetical protein
MKRTLLCLMVLITAVVSATAATLEWDKNQEPEVAGYRAYRGTASRSYDWIMDVGTNTTCLLSNLQCGTTYYFAVTAYTVDGLESDFSDEVAWKPRCPIPSPPAGIRLVGTNLPPLIKVPIQVGTDIGEWRQIGSVNLYGTNVSGFLKLGE